MSCEAEEDQLCKRSPLERELDAITRHLEKLHRVFVNIVAGYIRIRIKKRGKSDCVGGERDAHATKHQNFE